MFLLWLADLITEKGFGNGISVILMLSYFFLEGVKYEKVAKGIIVTVSHGVNFSDSAARSNGETDKLDKFFYER